MIYLQGFGACWWARQWWLTHTLPPLNAPSTAGCTDTNKELSGDKSKCVCKPGYATGGDGSCTPCATGTYAAVPDTAQCTNCSAGTYSAAEGATACATCGANTYSAAGAAACETCPAGTIISEDKTMCTGEPPLGACARRGRASKVLSSSQPCPRPCSACLPAAC